MKKSFLFALISVLIGLSSLAILVLFKEGHIPENIFFPAWYILSILFSVVFLSKLEYFK